MLRFRLKEKCGAHAERGPRGLRTYKSGDVIETNHELDKMFARTGKFERLPEGSEAAAGEVAVAPPHVVPDDWGIDVTAVNWGGLLTGPYRVYQRSRWYNLVDSNTDTRLNDKSLTREQVDAFIDEILSP